ncbi:MAG: helix-turn-helix transcriptional regulator [Clostridia bacterium]|nr:helix-turn-helix transcriptional regulator [Clostridia bacterium]
MDLNDIITRISQLRTRAGLSARELSLRIGKNEAYINRLEYKRNFEPSITVINDIAEACGSSLEEFFYYDIMQYKADKQIIDLLKRVPDQKKQAWIELLSK